jgi:hypothetical protein
VGAPVRGALRCQGTVGASEQRSIWNESPGLMSLS